MSESRAELRQLIDVLPVRKIRLAKSYLRFLIDEDEDDTFLLRVVEGDLTDQDKEDLAEARVDAAEGRSISWDEAKKELGL